MRLEAYAKVNLCLEVLGRRSDGYHEVRSIMQTVDLADEVAVTDSDVLEVTCDDPAIAPENNLARKAAVEFAKSCGRRPLVKIDIAKRIPVGMGLGGGSSDAAAVIVALNELWEVDYPLAELSEIAARLGSDVPFFLWGGAALASGRGDTIEPLPALAGIGLTLVCPEESVENKTARMYSRLTASHYSDGGVTRWLLQNMMAGQYSDDLFCNVFEDIALQEFPGLRGIRDTLEEGTGRRAHLTGAGPAWFLMPSSVGDCQHVARALRERGARSYPLKTTGRAETSSIRVKSSRP